MAWRTLHFGFISLACLIRRQISGPKIKTINEEKDSHPLDLGEPAILQYAKWYDDRSSSHLASS